MREFSREAKAGLDSQYTQNDTEDALMRHAFLWHHFNTPAVDYGRALSREAKAGLDSQYDDKPYTHSVSTEDFYAFVQRVAEMPLTQWQKDVIVYFDEASEKAEKSAPVVKYVLAAGQENAEALACMIVAGVIPDLYLFRCDCLRAWRESGLVEQRRYQPWAVGFQSVLGQLKISSSSRIN